MPTHLRYWYHEYTNTIYIDLHFTQKEVYTNTQQCPFVLLCSMDICIFKQWQNKDIYYHFQLGTHCGRLTYTYVRNLTWHSLRLWHVVWSAPSHCWFNVSLAYFDISICIGVLSVYCWFIVCLSSNFNAGIKVIRAFKKELLKHICDASI